MRFGKGWRVLEIVGLLNSFVFEYLSGNAERFGHAEFEMFDDS